MVELDLSGSLNNGRFATAGGYFNVMNKDTSFGFRSIAIGPRIYSMTMIFSASDLGLDGNFDTWWKYYNWSAGTQTK